MSELTPEEKKKYERMGNRIGIAVLIAVPVICLGPSVYEVAGISTWVNHHVKTVHIILILVGAVIALSLLYLIYRFFLSNATTRIFGLLGIGASLICGATSGFILWAALFGGGTKLSHGADPGEFMFRDGVFYPLMTILCGAVGALFISIAGYEFLMVEISSLLKINYKSRTAVSKDMNDQTAEQIVMSGTLLSLLMSISFTIFFFKYFSD